MVVDNTSPTGHGIRVLLVDDQPIIGNAVRQMLSGETDIAFHYCARATEAVKQANLFLPTVILLDLVMPEIDGLLLVKFFRANKSTREVPIIVLSSKEEADIKARAFTLGANDYLVKLPDSLELIARVRYHSKAYNNLLQKNEAMRELAQANQVISSLNTRLQSENLRMSAELDVARRLQQLLLPQAGELSQINDLEIACYMEPAEEVGGDYYDVLPYPGGVLIGMGDVTGHGLDSGVLAIMAQMGIRTLLAGSEPRLAAFLAALNRSLHANIQRMGNDKNMSLALLDYRQGRVAVSGQHEDLLIVRDGNVEKLDTTELGMPLGMLEEVDEFLGQAEFELRPGDLLALYSDGITEAENSDRALYGLERLRDLLARHWQAPCENLIQLIIREVKDHIGDRRVFDDMTLMLLRRKFK